MRIDVFCESGAKYGLGHFYRCVKLIALCAKTRQVNALTLHNRVVGDFIPPSLAQLLDKELLESISYECKNYEWLSTQPQMLDIAIVDSYEAQEWFYYRLKSQSKALICLDDTLRDVYPPQSYILNPTPHIQEYFSHKNYYLWCGEEYIIPPIMPTQDYTQDFKRDFIQDSMQKCGKNISCINVFVTFGGVDSGNLTQELIENLNILADSIFLESCHFHIILGGGYPHTLCIPPRLTSYISTYHNLNPKDFLAKAQECDCAISAGGGSMLELLTLKIPSIIIESATNQHLHITKWAQKGAIATAKTPLDALEILRIWYKDILESSANDFDTHTKPQTPKSLESIKTTLQDLHPSEKLLDSLSALFTQIHNLISHNINARDKSVDSRNSLIALPFTHLTQEESEIVLSMRNHKQVAQWMYSSYITPASHKAFLAHLTNDTSKQYWLFKSNDEYIGVGSLTRINPAHKHAFIGIYTNPLCDKNSKGAQILSFLESYAMRNLTLHTLHLEVLIHNERAIKFYEKCGYMREGVLHDFVCRKDDEQRRYYDVILMYKELK
ncbi:UDP-4-amino-4,6-dideoxy-N-acetyl-beta-L-altrosamine N-acetyltransferase [Helicobacter typhlonius]|uniref:UDP-4-amino-4, 6-dideoxy-N-acetyl-beta-L-altrosamine N-acetyltransferase n=1 Tax=Helicobacter typhlonius TaxID=76936 RepID=UPI002FDF8904